jgi:H+/Cl- antiporter ClcA
METHREDDEEQKYEHELESFDAGKNGNGDGDEDEEGPHKESALSVVVKRTASAVNAVKGLVGYDGVNHSDLDPTSPSRRPASDPGDDSPAKIHRHISKSDISFDSAKKTIIERKNTAIRLVKDVKEMVVDLAPDKEEIYPWVNVVIVAVSVGTIEFLPAFVLAWSISAKYDFLDYIINNYGLAIMMAVNVSLSMVMVVSACLLTRLVPCASGSGIPNLIAYLYSGKLTDPDLLSLKMVIVKMFGVILAISGGLPIGREGPAIHIGAGVGDFTNRMFDKIVEFRTGVKVPFDGTVKSNVVMMGVTAGFASAFRAPMGGMLYCIEEIATHWDIKSHMTVGAQTFFAAAISAFVTDLIIRLTQDSGAVQFSSIIIFEGDEIALQAGTVYHNYDYFGFLVITVICGILSGVTTHASNYIRAWRFQKPERQHLWRVIFDASLIAAITAIAFSMDSLIYRRCKHVPEDADDGSHRLLSGGGGSRQFVQYNCHKEDYSELASLSLTGEESVIRHLLSRDDEEFELAPLLIFFGVYLPLSLIARSLPLPMGSFVPNLLVGSLVGRIIGEVCELVFPDHLISQPGVYALIGAASMLAGWTRTMIAVVVLLVEITGDVGMSIPLIVSSIIARGISIQIANHSFTHHYFYELIDNPRNGDLAILHPNDWEPQSRKKRRLTKRDSLRITEVPAGMEEEPAAGADLGATVSSGKSYDYETGGEEEGQQGTELEMVEQGTRTADLTSSY